MTQTISLSKSVFENLISRIDRLEKMVFNRSGSGVLKKIKNYEKEKEQGKLKKLKSVSELFS